MTTLAIHRQLPGRSTPYSMADHRSGRCGRQLGEADLRSHRPLGNVSRESVSAMAIYRQLLNSQFTSRNELLNALSSIHLARVQVPFGVDGDLMHPMKLTGVSSATSDGRKHLA
jgi:hypothetical protein